MSKIIVYDVAQICQRGHVVNENSQRYPQKNDKFCSQCGAQTITACPSCNSQIRGASHVTGAAVSFEYDKPSFCTNCSQAYPWMAEGLQAAKDLALELEGLKDSEREAVAKRLDDIVRDTPRTQLAILQLKKFLSRSKGPAAIALRDTLLPVATEAARKALLGA